MPAPLKVIPSMTADEQVSYAEQMLAVINQRIAERPKSNVPDQILNDLIDAKTYYITLADDGRNRNRVR